MLNKESGLEKEGSQLCYRCKSIPATTFFSNGKPRNKHERRFGPTEPHQLIEGLDAFAELKLSAAAGCDLCELFQDALEIVDLDPDRRLRRHPEYFKGGIRLQRAFPNNLHIAFGSFWRNWIEPRLVIHTEKSTTRSIEPPLYVVETESDSPANFALARSWLAECCKDHVECRDPLEFELPIRLLDISIPSKPGIIRLISAVDLGPKGRADYAALSHCWGSFQPLQTTTYLPSRMDTDRRELHTAYVASYTNSPGPGGHCEKRALQV